MLILHTSDWHLGRSLHRADLTPAFELWCSHLVDLVKSREIDAVLISGDVYDRAVPPTSAVELFDRTLAELADLTTVIATSGNHDSPQRLGFGASVMRPNIHMRTDARQCGNPVEIFGKDGNRAYVYPIPYLDPDVERRNLASGNAPETLEPHESKAFPSFDSPGKGKATVPANGTFPGNESTVVTHGESGDVVENRSDEGSDNANSTVPHAGGDGDRSASSGDENSAAANGTSNAEALLPRSHEAVLAAALQLVASDIRKRSQDVARIVMAHAFVTGGEPSDSERDIAVGGVDSAPSGLFRLGDEGPGPISYVALGHLHSPQRAGGPDDPPMRYSGSPLPFSFSETKPKSSVLLHIDGSRVETEIVPSPTWRTVRTLIGSLDELEAWAPHETAEAFFRIVVTDSSRPADMAARVYRAFDNVLELQHRPQDRVSSGGSAESIASMAPIDILSSFMVSSGNRELTEEERKILEEVWETARLQGERR